MAVPVPLIVPPWVRIVSEPVKTEPTWSFARADPDSGPSIGPSSISCEPSGLTRCRCPVAVPLRVRAACADGGRARADWQLARVSAAIAASQQRQTREVLLAVFAAVPYLAIDSINV